MKELNECLNTKRQIDEINEKICKLKAIILSPKNQVITGMPRGGNSENAVEKYMIKVEELEDKKRRLAKYQMEQWHYIQTRAENAHISYENIRLLFLRFCMGYSWKRCTRQMQEEYGNWNINKVFAIYRKIRKTLED